MPLLWGHMPVSSAARLAEQVGLVVKHWRNVTPSSASRCMAGVGTG